MRYPIKHIILLKIISCNWLGMRIMAKEKKEQKKERKKLSLVLNIVIYTVLGLILVFDVFALITKIQMGSEKGAANFFGYEARIVLTGSMDGDDSFYKEHPEYEIKRISVHDAVFVNTVPKDEEKQESYFANIKVGDVLTFIYQKAGNVVVTHRVISIEKNAYHYVYTLRGDNPSGDKIVYDNDDRTQKVASDTGLIIGKVTGVSTFLGNTLYVLSSNKLVLIFIVVVPSALLTFYEIGKIIYVIKTGKKEKQLAALEANQKEKDDELERLKAELARMKNEANQKEDNEKKE